MERYAKPGPTQEFIPFDRATLCVRQLCRGQPTIVLHGGPTFDHTYLLPEMDRLAETVRLIYYDQRGRGQSAADVHPDDVTIASEIADVERVRHHLGLEVVCLLGHSWGALLALEYALRHPGRVSHLILMNTAPASAADWELLRQEIQTRAGEDAARMQDLAATPAYIAGDPDTVTAHYHLYFGTTLARPEELEVVVRRLRASFTTGGILKARAIGGRLMDETWRVPGYGLLSQLRQLSHPTLIVHGDRDFVPVACAERIAAAIPGARLHLLQDCGHFAYLERPSDVYAAVTAFLGNDQPGEC